MGKRLPVLVEEVERTALAARWPEPVLTLSDSERASKVRAGSDSVILHDGDRTRGFVRAVLKVPHDHPKAAVYGVFVEVERDGYAALKRAHAEKRAVRVWGKLATRLPFLDAAYGARVQILEDGSELRARVVEVDSELLRKGPAIGPR